MDVEGYSPWVRRIIRDRVARWAIVPRVLWMTKAYAALQDSPSFRVRHELEGESMKLEADDRGFYPVHPCERCGEPLKGQGTGYPAELYAGTYTGLCYPCTREPAKVIATKKLDGAQVWDYPPAQASYRRNRERFIGYPGCQRCNGTGILPWGASGPYERCPSCESRYDAHELRMRYTKASLEIYKQATARHEARMEREAGVSVSLSWEQKQAVIMRLGSERIKELTAESWEWYDAQIVRLREAARKLGTFD